MDNNKIGKFIAELRKSKNLTQQELGNKLFVTDKAVSKWERGLSLPDITILETLASELDVDVSEILQGEKGTKKIDIDKVLQEETLKLKNNNKKKFIKIIIPTIIVLAVLICLLFKNLYIGYEIKNVKFHNGYQERNIQIGVPKLSFMMKNNDRSYSFKSFRGGNVLETEIKRYLKTLKYLNCNDTIYYYDKTNDFSIINYFTKDKFLYSTIAYELSDGDYCYRQKLNEYSKYIDLKTLHTMNATLGFILSEENIGKTMIQVLDDIIVKENEYRFTIKMRVLYVVKSTQAHVIEDSEGTYEIKDGKLIYYRDKIILAKDESIIPKVSTFTIKDKTLILDDNYLKEYEDEIILK